MPTMTVVTMATTTATGYPVAATLPPFSRHPRTALPVHAKHGNGQPIRGTLPATMVVTVMPPMTVVTMTTTTGYPVTATLPPFSRHPRTALPVHAKHGNGQPIRGSLAANAILEEIPEGDYFPTTLARGENISFEDDGLRVLATPKIDGYII